MVDVCSHEYQSTNQSINQFINVYMTMSVPE